jgi:spermidine synthase
VTIHGYQFHDESLRDLPTSYYGKNSGAGLAILDHPNRGNGMRVGVLGLGVGTLAVYGQPGDVYRFYEINQAVIRLAEGENGYFSFLNNSQARVEIVPGDARLSLEQELADGKPQNYDVLVVDVFSSDSIPVYLLDEESFKVFLQQLSLQGILAIHISNRRLDLVPVIWTLAGYFGLARALIIDTGDGVITYPSSWFLLARNPALLADPAIASRAKPMSNYVSHVRLWTDEYNNLFQILK